MNWIKISISHLNEKKLSGLLSVILMSFGVGIILILFLMGSKVEDTFYNNIRGVDMVVGAKGSPLQIILSSVYHMDAPTGNIHGSEVKKIAQHNLVKQAIPLSYGDSHKGYRIVGTTASYLELYDGKIAEGQMFQQPLEVLIGSKVAEILEVEIGDEIISSHGLTKNAIEQHGDHSYKVVGILETSASVMDQLILTSLNSVWNVHGHDEEGHDDHGHSHHHEVALISSVSEIEDDQEITAMLVKFKSPMATFNLPRIVNTKTNMQAALPSIEVNRLIGLLGIGINTLKAIAILIMALSCISVFVALLANLKEKKYELALLRSFGASRLKLFQVIFQEGILLTITGYVFGVIISRIAIRVISGFSEQSFLTDSFLSFTSFDGYLLIVSLLLGTISALIPAIRAYRLNISETLSHD